VTVGLFTSLFTLPLAPVRGVAWVAEQVAEEVERDMYDPARLRSELLRLELDHDAGLVGDREYEARSEELIERITAAAPQRELAPLRPEVHDG
jgi:hypothetical protein